MESRPAPLIALVEVSSQMGGIEFSTLYLAANLPPDTFRIVVICPEEGDLPQRCRDAGIDVRILPQPPLLSSSGRLLGLHIPNALAFVINPILMLWVAARLSRLLRQLEVDLVCTKGVYAHFYGGAAARFARLPCVWHVQDFISEKLGVFFPAVFGLAARLFASRVIADGTPIRNQMAPYYPQDRIDVIFNGVDLTEFSPNVDGSAVRQEWGVSDHEVLISNVARLTPWKGQDHLVQAFSAVCLELPRARLVLVGSPVFDSDVFERRLRDLVSQLQIEDRVTFAGFRRDLPNVLAATDLYVHCSVEKDTSPLAVVSAIASGKPIIFTTVPGVAELFEEGVDGIGVPPSNADALANALQACVTRPEQQTSLGRAARKKAETSLGIEQFASNCAAVFAQALNDSGLHSR